MMLTITSKNGTPIDIKVLGLNILKLKQHELPHFKATFQAYLQQLYDKGFVNFQKVEIRGKFSSGQSGAIVLPIMLYRSESDSGFNHYRVLKYDEATRVRQEAIRFNSLVSPKQGPGVPYEEIRVFFSKKSLMHVSYNLPNDYNNKE